MKKLMLVLMSVVLLLSACGKGKTEHTMQQDGGGAAEHSGHAGADHGDSGKTGTAAAKAQAQWKLSSDKPEAKQQTTLSLQIKDQNGKPIEQFDISHEKKMHLIVVSKDLSYFDHIHPEYKGNGTFEVTTAFPAGGEYKLVADFIPTGIGAMTQTHWVQVQGAAAPSATIQPDTNKTKLVDGKAVTFTTDKLAAGKETVLNFHMEEADSRKPITNLQPYLGAVGHVVIMSADTEQYLHVHPMDEKAAGPDAKFMTTFPKPGTYKIWGQFQRDGKLFIASYVVQVP